MRWLLALALIFVTLGCKESGPVRHRLTGKVTLDGAPLGEGYLKLDSPDGSTSSEGTFIKDGVYEARVAPGPRLVRISAERTIEGKTDKTGVPIKEQFVRARYNTATVLKIDVKGDQTENFELQSK